MHRRLNIALRTATCVVAVALAAGPAAAASTDAERIATYQLFRSAFDASDYAVALPLAERLATQTEEQYGADSRELVNPLTNVGTVQFRLGNTAAAETAYQRGLRLIDGKAPGADRMLIRPLQGLGETYLTLGRHAEAATALKRAVDLSRNVDGLFNVGQLDILDPLIEAYIRLDRTQEAEKESQYAFRVAEQNYGRGDLRLLDPLDRYARWFEYIGRYTTARGLHARALQIAERAKGRGAVEGVDALRGLARTYYNEFLYGPEETEQPTEGFQQSGALATSQSSGRLNPDGERSLQLALEALAKTEPVDRRARGGTLIELGDWYLIGGSSPKALQSYKDGWTELAAAGTDATKPLLAPRRLAYRHPSASIARARPSDPENYEERFVELKFRVLADGKVTDVTTASTDAPIAIERATVFAIRKARFAPRLDNGQPVETVDVTHRERVIVRKPAAAPSPATK